MSATPVTECGLCGSNRLESVLYLGTSPATCHMVKVGEHPATEERHPLELLRCERCTLVQLSVIVDPNHVFPDDYPYSSGNSRMLHKNFGDLADSMKGFHEGLVPQDLVVDIGANDGTLLSKFGDVRKLGVEPTDQCHKIDGEYVQAFFDEELAEWIVGEFGKAKVVTACNVLAHVPDIGSVMRGIKRLLAHDGVLVAENHDLASVVDQYQWDTVYHEHLRYYSPFSFYRLLKEHGLKPGPHTWIPTHGGSFRMTASRRGTWSPDPPFQPYDFQGLADMALDTRAAIREATKAGMWGIGATARATTIINYCGLDVQDIHCVCEVAGSDKIGRYIPGTRISVVDEQALLDEQPARAMLFSWHMAEVIVPKLQAAGYRGEIVMPLPYPWSAQRLAA